MGNKNSRSGTGDEYFRPVEDSISWYEDWMSKQLDKEAPEVKEIYNEDGDIINAEKVQQAEEKRQHLRERLEREVSDKLVDAGVACALAEAPVPVARLRSLSTLRHGLSFVAHSPSPRRFAIAADKTKSRWYVALRMPDWATLDLEEEELRGFGGLLRRGVTRAADAAPERLLKWILELPTTKELVLCGHGFAAAIALAVCLKLVGSQEDDQVRQKIHCVVFGSTLAVDEALAHNLESDWPLLKHRIHCVYVEGDPVPLGVELVAAAAKSLKKATKEVTSCVVQLVEQSVIVGPEGNDAGKEKQGLNLQKAVDNAMGKLSLAKISALRPPWLLVGHVHILDGSHTTVRSASPFDSSNRQFDHALLLKHSIESYLQELTRVTTSRDGAKQVATDALQATFLAPGEITVTAERMGRHLTLVIRGSKLALVEECRVALDPESSESHASEHAPSKIGTLLASREQNTIEDYGEGDAIRIHLPRDFLGRVELVMAVSTRPVIVTVPVEEELDDLLRDHIDSHALHLINRFTGDQSIHLFPNLFKVVLIICSNLGTDDKHATEHERWGALGETEAWVRDCCRTCDSMASLVRLDKLAAWPLNELPYLQTLLASAAATTYSRDEQRTVFAKHLRAMLLEVRADIAELKDAQLPPWTIANLWTWFEGEGISDEGIMRQFSVLGTQEQTALGVTGRLPHLDLFPTRSSYHPSRIVTDMLLDIATKDRNAALKLALEKADVVCAGVTATMGGVEQPFLLKIEAPMSVKRAAGLACGGLWRVAGVAYNVSCNDIKAVYCGVYMLKNMALKLSADASSHQPVTDAFYALDPRHTHRFYKRRAAIASGTAEEVQVGRQGKRSWDQHRGPWTQTLDFLLSLLQESNSGDIYANQLIISQMMQSDNAGRDPVRNTWHDEVAMPSTFKRLNGTFFKVTTIFDECIMELSAKGRTRVKESMWDLCRMAALNHKLWSLLAADYRVGIVGTGRVGKSTLIEALTGNVFANSGPYNENQTTTVFAYRRHKLVIFDFPGWDDPSAYSGLTSRGLEVLDMVIVVIDSSRPTLEGPVGVLADLARVPTAQRPQILVCLNRADQWIGLIHHMPGESFTNIGKRIASSLSEKGEQLAKAVAFRIQQEGNTFFDCHPTCFAIPSNPLLPLAMQQMETNYAREALQHARVFDAAAVVDWMQIKVPSPWQVEVSNLKQARPWTATSAGKGAVWRDRPVETLTNVETE